jgi:hypothetical protein
VAGLLYGPLVHFFAREARDKVRPDPLMVELQGALRSATLMFITVHVN